MKRLRIISFFYFLSGALGLVYEVAFGKYLGYAFGATAYASSAVLVAFMGGLALGAAVAARFENRAKRPLIVYGLVEVAIGVFCFFTPRLFGWVTDKYVHLASEMPHNLVRLSMLRAGMATIVALIPAFGMGTTLPLLARFVSKEDPHNKKRRLAALYGLNTAGGAFGALFSAYFVLPTIGLPGTLRFSAATSFSIGLFAIAFGLPEGSDEKKSEIAKAELSERENDEALPTALHLAPSETAKDSMRTALVIAALSGLLVFGCEVVFTHLLALVIGTSVYAFGLMLAIFLACLALGAPLATRLERKFAGGALSWSLALTGIFLAGSLVIWDKLPFAFIALGPYVKSWAGRELVRGLAALVALVLPVTAMGTVFPLVLRRARSTSIGADVGKIATVSALGSIAGALLFGFLILPRLGSTRSILFVAITYSIASLFAARGIAAKSSSRSRWVAAAACVVALAVPALNMRALTGGESVYFDQALVPDATLENAHEDIHGLTAVVRDSTGEHTLLTNGIAEGSDVSAVHDNEALALLPSVFEKSRDRALVIGLGTGVTVDTMRAFGFKEIAVAEISPAIVDYARTTFSSANHRVLDDPHVHVRIDDGRNTLLIEKTRYDVITIDVTRIWLADAANLYSREFYQLVNSRLTDTGVLQQRVAFDHTTRQTVASILSTLRETFQYVALFMSQHEGHILASRAPFKIQRPALIALGKDPEIARVLGDARPLDFVKGILLDETAIDKFVLDTVDEGSLERNDLISTDDNLLLEYRTPKGNVPGTDDISDTIATLSAYKKRDLLLQHLSMK